MDEKNSCFDTKKFSEDFRNKHLERIGQGWCEKSIFFSSFLHQISNFKKAENMLNFDVVVFISYIDSLYLASIEEQEVVPILYSRWHTLRISTLTLPMHLGLMNIYLFKVQA